MKKITPEELADILGKHKKWLNNEEGGERADLSDARLCGAALGNASLGNASLRNADLRAATLRGADLSDADLSGTDLRYADLRNADLRYANLSAADLYKADLRNTILRKAILRGARLSGADLHGADLDYSSWPLWCGSLKVKIDDRIARQLLYHLLRCCAVSDISDELSAALSAPDLIAQANMFHRAEECGEIPAPLEVTR